MKIAQIATLTESVPPTWHGGIENIISLITEELVERGHEVFLFASADSKTNAKLVSSSKISFRTAGKPDILLDFIHTNKAFLKAGNFDIIHNHTDYFGLGFADFVNTPVVTTLHSPFSEEEARKLLESFAHLNYVALSFSHKRSLPAILNIVRVIYNGINVQTFPFSDKKQDFMLFLGRIHPDKGTHIAIEAAQKTGKPLVIAAQIDRYNHRYFNEIIKPQIDNKLIFFEGEVNQEQKRELLKNAACLLCPVTWAEPFGLVIIESLACGTPVVGLNKGSTPEIIIDGKTGFIAETESGLVYGIENIHKIDPHICRKHVQENFSSKRMVDEYIKIYEEIIKNYELKIKNYQIPVRTLPPLYNELTNFLQMPPEKIINYMERSHELVVHEWENFFAHLNIMDSTRSPTKKQVENFYKNSKYYLFDLCARSIEETYKEWMVYIGDKCREYGCKSILHYGCGIGDIAFFISTNAHKLILAEIDSIPFFFAKWRHERAGVTGLEYITIENDKSLEINKVDCILCIDVLEHRFEPYDYFKDMISLLKERGILFLAADFREVFHYPLHIDSNTQYRYTFNPERLGLVRLNNRQPAIYRKNSNGL